MELPSQQGQRPMGPPNWKGERSETSKHPGMSPAVVGTRAQPWERVASGYTLSWRGTKPWQPPGSPPWLTCEPQMPTKTSVPLAILHHLLEIFHPPGYHLLYEYFLSCFTALIN